MKLKVPRDAWHFAQRGETMEQALSVSQLNQYIRMRLEQDEVLQQVCVCGELSNVTLHRSGHIYLKIKDEQSVISGVMFRFNAARLDFTPTEGQRVIVYGCITVYEPAGSYQIKISVMKLDGQGQLYAAFEKLKVKLDKMGLFDVAHKLALPKFPHTIGVITSPTGAAVRDIIKVCSRRYPQAEILLYPVLVQGEQAAPDLIKAVEWFDANRAADVLIIGRGGGSIEDLWAFNNEALAYAVYNCEIPTVSAVGHEIDYTICDFVADVRAATPSMAAELVCPDRREYLQRIQALRTRLGNALISKSNLLSTKFESLKNRQIWKDESRMLSRFYMLLDDRSETLYRSVQQCIDRRTTRFEKNVIKLDALSPLSTLARGYAAVYDEKNKMITDFSDTHSGEHITVRLKNTTADCLVERVEVK